MERQRQGPIERILVPVDFSEPSLDAWTSARELARALGAAVEALYVYESYVTAGRGVVTLADTESRLQGHLQRCLGAGAKVSVRDGRPAPRINAFAREAGCGLIVMGTRGRTGLQRAALGSVAEGVCRESTTPVLVLRKAARPPRSILVPVNFQPYALRCLFDVSRIAEALGARLDALVVREGAGPDGLTDADFRQMLERLAPCFRGGPPSILMREGEPAEEIALAGERYDWVALAAHRKPGLQDRILGSTAERVLRASSAPVLCLPSGEFTPAGGEPAASASRQR